MNGKNLLNPTRSSTIMSASPAGASSVSTPRTIAKCRSFNEAHCNKSRVKIVVSFIDKAAFVDQN